MYWLITAYDVLGTVRLTARCIGDRESDGAPLEPIFHRTAQVPLPRHLASLADTLAWLVEELNDMAYEDLPSLPDDHG